MDNKEQKPVGRTQKNADKNKIDTRISQSSGLNRPFNHQMHVDQYQEVDDLDLFQKQLIRIVRETTTEQRHQELADRINTLDVKGIVPGQGYNDYPTRFQFMLDTISLLGELGELEQAANLANRVIPLAEIVNPNSADTQQLMLLWILRADMLWTLANVFGQDDLYHQSFECLKYARDFAQSIDQQDVTIHEYTAARYLSLVDSELNPIENLNLAEKLLSPLAHEQKLNARGWRLYFQVMYKQEKYEEASAAAKIMMTTADATDGSMLTGVKMQEIIAVELLSKYKGPKEFLLEFGPFAWPIYAECKKIYLSEAWSKFYNTPMPDISNERNASFPIVNNDTIVYERGLYIASVDELTMYGNIHSRVKSRQAFQSDGELLKSYRSVPTALLFTYMRQIDKSTKAQFHLPASLEFFVNWGRSFVHNDPQGCHYYISQMLEYFERHSQETNAAHHCAAMYAGLLLEIVGPPDCEEMCSYIAHLEATDHITALAKGKRRTQFILLPDS